MTQAPYTFLPPGPQAPPELMQRALIGAVVVHAVMLLGIGIGWEQPAPASSRLEITLTTLRSDLLPNDADFIANADHRGSGDAAERALMTTDRLYKSGIDRGPQSPRETIAARAAAQVTTPVVSRDSDTAQIDKAQSDPRQQPPELADGSDPLTRLQREIVALEARLDRQQQEIAKAPRVRRLTSVSTRRAEDAAYLHHWRKRIESVGNAHYPQVAAQQGIEGELRLAVTLLPDGRVHEVNTLKSSGKPVLDRAALHIVYRAQPFEPFTADMRKSMDRLEIIRTWRFEHATLTALE